MNSNLPNNFNNRGGVVVKETYSAFSGPLPSPEVLKKFDEVVPGAAERIIKMAEEQSTHRRSLEKGVIESDIIRSKWGQILGFIIAIFGLVVSTLISIYGNAATGALIGFTTIASLVSVFMYGSKTRSKEREEKKS
jgi:uncharacterized membrane protein